MVLNLLTTKYMKAYIHYEGIVRVDELPVPVNALREIILNSICHKSYEEFVPIQIRVYDDRIIISNTCRLPLGWTVKNLLGKHISIPYNPDIANAFFRAGFIESWGRGIEKVLATCKEYGCPTPQWVFDGSVLSMTMKYKKAESESEDKNDRLDKISDQDTVMDEIVRDVSQMLLSVAKSGQGELGIVTLMETAKKTSKRQYRRDILVPALESGLIERTIPDKPTSRYQKYRLTDNALKILKGNK